MPQMDGCTLANQLQEENPELPVLLISGYFENDSAERSRFPLLSKPFSVSFAAADRAPSAESRGWPRRGSPVRAGHLLKCRAKAGRRLNGGESNW